MYSTLRGLRSHMQQDLAALYDAREIEQLFYIVCEDVLGKKRSAVLLELEDELPDSARVVLGEVLDLLKQHMPVQYVTQQAHFMGHPFYVDESVLIPRPETEELVLWILDVETTNDLSVLDVGTGSGIIPISLALKNPNWDIHACDVSNEALVVARRNVRELLKQGGVVLYREDILSPKTQYKASLDVIVSNPPYVLESDKDAMARHVLDFEPHVALFVEDHDPLTFYRHILAYGRENLKNGGRVYFEIHEDLASQMEELLTSGGYTSIEIRKDLQGKARMARAVKA